jgi:hypothetical protein
MSERRPVSTRRPVPDHVFGGRLSGSYLLDLEVVGVDEVPRDPERTDPSPSGARLATP